MSRPILSHVRIIRQGCRIKTDAMMSLFTPLSEWLSYGAHIHVHTCFTAFVVATHLSMARTNERGDADADEDPDLLT